MIFRLYCYIATWNIHSKYLFPLPCHRHIQPCYSALVCWLEAMRDAIHVEDTAWLRGASVVKSFVGTTFFEINNKEHPR